MKLYRITKIEEIDHGCEGIPEGGQVEVYVYLRAIDGTTQVIRHSDLLLYERKIDQGDQVTIAEDGTFYRWCIHKAACPGK